MGDQRPVIADEGNRESSCPTTHTGTPKRIEERGRSGGDAGRMRAGAAKADRVAVRARVIRKGIASGLVLLAAACVSPGPPVAPTPPRGLRPYTVDGETYRPIRDWRGYTEEGLASWYGPPHHGRRTASGEPFDTYGDLTAAHRTLPFDVCVDVENLEDGERVRVRITDRGPFANGRVIDLSKRAAEQLGLVEKGLTRVRVEALALADASGRCTSEAAEGRIAPLPQAGTHGERR